MSVHQLKDGRWIVQYKDAGRTTREYFGRGQVAETMARERNDELGLRGWTRRTPPPRAFLFETLTQEYINKKYQELPEESFSALWYKLLGVILPEFGHLPVGQITEHRLDQYVTRRLADGVKKTTIHRELSDLQAILNWGVRQGFVAFNPVAGYKKPRRDDEIIQPVTREEARRILAAAPPHLARALYISYYTGLRPGRRELLSLTWDRVDFDGNTIMVTSALKGGLKYRTVPLHKKLRRLLKKWFKEDQVPGKEDQAPADWSPPTHIVHWRGRPIQSVKSAFATAKTNAKISRKLTPYAFRHAFVSSILAAGGDLKSTSELVGHSRPDTTQRIYQHTNTRLHRDAIDKLPSL